MKLNFATFVFLGGLTASSVMAETVSCPDLATAVQVAACPSEEDLQFTFTGYCSDNARMYGKGSDVCTDYQRYRKMKNLALWESGDGAFQAYISCDLPAAAVKAAKASGISVDRKKEITRLVCTYPEGIVFTNRMRAECSVDEKVNCSADPSGCKASCQ
jgi:hypothetical protein